ncbi:MAG: hypothetical protein AB1656_20215 [Candidatus Omnitrophota bacterium]
METHVNPELERLHLDIVKRRREEMRNQQVELVDGKDALAMARKIIDELNIPFIRNLLLHYSRLDGSSYFRRTYRGRPVPTQVVCTQILVG